MQEAHGYKHKFIRHPHRYSHLRKFIYALQKPPPIPFSGLELHQSTERIRFLHPIAMLSFGSRSLPPDLALEASDALTLYEALASCKDRLPSGIEHLHPTKFFPERKFLRQMDILRYEDALKEVLTPLIAISDPQDSSSVMKAIIHHLEDPILQEIPKGLLNNIPSRVIFRRNLIHFVSDLHTKGDLVSPCSDFTIISHLVVIIYSQQFCSRSTEMIVRSWREIFWQHFSLRKTSGAKQVPNGTRSSMNGRIGRYVQKKGSDWRSARRNKRKIRTHLVQQTLKKALGKILSIQMIRHHNSHLLEAIRSIQKASSMTTLIISSGLWKNNNGHLSACGVASQYTTLV